MGCSWPISLCSARSRSSGELKLSQTHVFWQTRLGQWFTQRRQLVQAVIDVTAWILALTFAVLVRYDFHWSEVSWIQLAVILPLTGMAQVVAGLASGLYLGRWRFGSFD